jgi:UDP-GlcNAc:undecaprenyl-phosphate GlcNAc-1-phosphate transferase
MNLNYNYLFIFIASFVLSLLLTAVYIFFAKKFNFVDDPTGNPRKIHKQPIPLGGGLAIFLSLFIIIAFLSKQGLLLDHKVTPQIIWAIFIASFILMFSGYWDDKFSLKPWQSLIGPIIAVVIVMFAGLHISYITNPAGGILNIDKVWFGYLSLILTFLWLLGMTYTTKLLDGIDGLASSICLVSSLMIFIVSLTWDIKYSTTSFIALALAGAALGFLVWNWHPAKVFLGEGGSTFLGFTLGILAIISGSKIATALLVMGAPIIDVALVIWRRLRQKKSIWQGDNEHLHFKLRQLGLSQSQIVLFLAFLSLCFGVIAIFFSTKIKIIFIFLFIVFLLIFNYFINNYLNKKYEKL